METPDRTRDDGYVDPLDEAPEVTPRGALVLTVLSFVLAAAEIVPTGLSFAIGPVGMACGLVANLKGRRAGFAGAVACAAATVLGLSFQFLLT